MKAVYFVTLYLSLIRDCTTVSWEDNFDLHYKENFCLGFKQEFFSAFDQRNKRVNQNYAN